jgi:hypothetical protein
VELCYWVHVLPDANGVGYLPICKGDGSPKDIYHVFGAFYCKLGILHFMVDLRKYLASIQSQRDHCHSSIAAHV